MGRRSGVRGFYHCVTTPSDPCMLPLVLLRNRRGEIVLKIICTKEEVKEREIQEGEVITYQGHTRERDQGTL